MTHLTLSWWNGKLYNIMVKCEISLIIDKEISANAQSKIFLLFLSTGSR